MKENKSKTFSLRMIVYCALLVAMEVVLSRFVSINTAGWKIGFSFVPVIVAAVLYGPYAAAVVDGLADLIGALLFPIGPYFPGFTICAVITGAVWGVFLYRKNPMKHTVRNIVLPSLINNVVIGLFINTVWVSILYGSKTYVGWFLYRLPEYAVLIPLNLLLIPVLVKLCEQLRKYKLK